MPLLDHPESPAFQYQDSSDNLSRILCRIPPLAVSQSRVFRMWIKRMSKSGILSEWTRESLPLQMPSFLSPPTSQYLYSEGNRALFVVQPVYLSQEHPRSFHLTCREYDIFANGDCQRGSPKRMFTLYCGFSRSGYLSIYSGKSVFSTFFQNPDV